MRRSRQPFEQVLFSAGQMNPIRHAPSRIMSASCLPSRSFFSGGRTLRTMSAPPDLFDIIDDLSADLCIGRVAVLGLLARAALDPHLESHLAPAV
jgi:hypothetical protein